MNLDIDKKISTIEANIDYLWSQLQDCNLCARHCSVNRTEVAGVCGADERCFVYSAFCHHGEEPPLSGSKGSGAVFFSGCSLRCVFCQNYKFSHTQDGLEVTVEALSEMFLDLQRRGAHNINLVTPTHYIAHIYKALLLAYKNGLSIPLVYNSSGYEDTQVLDCLDGVVDIYLPDFKYSESSVAKSYSNAQDYPEVAKNAILKMYQQRPDLVYENGLLVEGVIVRHLILPEHINNSKNCLKWLNENLPKAGFSVMSQYMPYYRACDYKGIDRPLSRREYDQVTDYVKELNIANGWVQEFVPREDLAGVYFDSLKDKK